jgi:hypothetical protein
MEDDMKMIGATAETAIVWSFEAHIEGKKLAMPLANLVQIFRCNRKFWVVAGFPFWNKGVRPPVLLSIF